ncbi:MAG: hypothetical protein ACREE2_20115 [Stellaceae bacterium]
MPAILSDLVETIAEIEGIDPGTVGLIARKLREEGLIAMSGRGPSAAKMGPADAANLLIAVNAANTTEEAVGVVRQYRRLQAAQAIDLSEPSRDVRLGRLGEAIEQLLEGIARSELAEPFMGRGFELNFQEAFGRGDVRIELRFCKSAPEASLRMTAVPPAGEVDPDRLRHLLAVIRPDVVLEFGPAASREPPAKNKKPCGDLVEETRITDQTLFAVGRLIGGKHIEQTEWWNGEAYASHPKAPPLHRRQLRRVRRMRRIRRLRGMRG